MEKADSIQEQMSNVNRKMKILWKNQKEMIEIKNTNKMKNTFNELISSLDTDKKRITKLEDTSVET